MKKILIAFVPLFLLLAGCGKDGAIGPQGPQGPQGPAGPGNTTINNDYVTINPGDWSYDNATLSWSVNALDQYITDDVINNGAVIVYSVNSSNNQTYLVPLPNYTADYSETNFIFNGYVTIEIFNGSSTSAPASIQFKIVILTREQLKVYPQLNTKNLAYEVLQKTLPPAELLKATHIAKSVSK